MPRGGRRPGAGRKPGQLNGRTIDAVKAMGPVGERAIGVLVSAMEDRSVPWSCRIQAASLVADRAFGRGPQSVSLDVTRRLNDLSLDETVVSGAGRFLGGAALRATGVGGACSTAQGLPVKCGSMGRRVKVTELLLMTQQSISKLLSPIQKSLSPCAVGIVAATCTLLAQKRSTGRPVSGLTLNQ
jgi:hypothetical protein